MPKVFDSSTVITPSVPTASIQSAIKLPINSLLPAEIVATCALISFESTGFDIFLISEIASSTALLIPFLIPIGLAPAVRFFKPSLKIA